MSVAKGSELQINNLYKTLGELKNCIRTAQITENVLHLSGQVPVTDASEFNMLVDEFASEQKLSVELDMQFVKTKTSRSVLGDQYKNQLSVNDDELKEFNDDEKTLARKIKFLAKHIRSSKHFVVYTGAGISTAAKIPDFRGPDGVWTRRDRGMAPPKGVSMMQAKPTYAHMCLVKWQDDGTMKYLTSQNVDGLHRRSGIKAEFISELHGNCYKEQCADTKCGAEFLRAYDVCAFHGPYFRDVKRDVLSKSGISHITGRKCDKCGNAMLRDSIIQFKETLPERDLTLAFEHSKKSDFALCIGSSLHVTPAADLPENVATVESGSGKTAPGKMCIINLQATGKDIEALQSGGILVHGKCDHVMELLMKELGYDFPNKAEEEKIGESEKKEMKECEQKAEDMEKCDCSRCINKRPQPLGPGQSCDVVVPARLFIGNSHLLIPDTQSESKESKRGFTLFVSSQEDKLTDDICKGFIDKVEVELPSKFDPALIVLPKPPYAISSCVSADEEPFDVTMRVHFKQEFGKRDVLTVKHKLKFDKSLTVVAADVPKIQLPAGFTAADFARAASRLRSVETRVTDVSGQSHVERVTRS